MRIFTAACTCSVCGEEGMARPGEASWEEGAMAHNDPNVCRAVLDRRRREIEERERALNTTRGDT